MHDPGKAILRELRVSLATSAHNPKVLSDLELEPDYFDLLDQEYD